MRIAETIKGITDLYNENPIKGWEILLKYTAAMQKIAKDYPTEPTPKKTVEYLTNLQDRIKDHEYKNRQYWRASALVTNTDPIKNETFFGDVTPLFLNGEIDETELKTIIENIFGKAEPKNGITFTRAGLGLAIVYLERYGGMSSQQYNIATYVDRYAAGLKNVHVEYERFKNSIQKNLLLHDITPNKNSVNTRKQAAEQVFYILKNESNKQAETQARSDFEAFLKHYE